MRVLGLDIATREGMEIHGSCRVLRFTVYGCAQPAGSKRAFVRGKRAIVTDANPKAGKWKDEVRQVAGRIMDGHDLLDGPLHLGLRFYRARPKSHSKRDGNRTAEGRRNPYPATRPDTTKLVRGVEDALTGIVYADDAAIVSQTAEKLCGTPERVEVAVWELLPTACEPEPAAPVTREGA